MLRVGVQRWRSSFHWSVDLDLPVDVVKKEVDQKAGNGDVEPNGKVHWASPGLRVLGFAHSAPVTFLTVEWIRFFW